MGEADTALLDGSYVSKGGLWSLRGRCPGSMKLEADKATSIGDRVNKGLDSETRGCQCLGPAARSRSKEMCLGTPHVLQSNYTILGGSAPSWVEGGHLSMIHFQRG